MDDRQNVGAHRDGNCAGDAGAGNGAPSSSAAVPGSELQYRELLQGLPVAAYACDAAGRIELANDAAIALWGRHPAANDRYCGAHRLYLIDGTPLDAANSAAARALRDGRPVAGFDYQVERPDGTRRIASARATPLIGAQGEIVGVINVIVDVTERHEAEAARALLASIVASSEDSVLSRTLDGIITSWNAGASRVFGYTAAESIGQPVAMLVPADCIEAERHVAERLARGERIEHFETQRVDKDGVRLDVSLTVSPIRDVSGATVGASEIARNITARKRADSELAATKDDLAQQVRALTRLHDLAMQLAGALALAPALDAVLAALVETHDADFGLVAVYDRRGNRLEPAAAHGFDDAAAAFMSGASPDVSPSGAAFLSRKREIVEDVELDARFDAFRDETRRLGVRAMHSTPILTRTTEILGVISVYFREPRRPSRRERQLANLCARYAAETIESARASQALRDSEERFRSVTMNAPVAVYIKDLEGRYTLCNPLASEALGRPRGAAGLTDLDLLPAEAAEALRKHDQQVVAAGRALEFEETIAGRSGPRDFLSVKFPLRDASGNAVGVCGVSVDVTERKRAQVALQESEQRLGLATRAGKLGVWDWDIVNDRVSWSQSLYAIHGVSPEWFAEHVGSFAALVHPEDRQRVSEAIQHALRSDAPYELEFRAQRPDGETAWLFTNAVVLREQGEPIRMLGATMDITENKRGEAALRASEERFRMLASHAPVGIFQSDAEGRNVFVNENWCTMAGMTSEEARGDGWLDALHPDDRERVIAGWQDAVQAGGASEAEFRFQTRDGVVTWLQGNAVPLSGNNGEVLGYIGTVADITSRKTAEEALRNSERMYRAIGESIDYGVWVCDSEGRLIYASESFLDLIGKTQAECAAFGWAESLHPDDLEQTLVAWRECVRSGEPWDVEHRFRAVDGSWRPILARGVPVRDDENRIIAWAGINLDISQLKKVENELRESEARFRSMADNAPVLIWVNGVGGCQYVNREYLHFTGAPQDQIVGMGFARFLHPDDAPGYLDAYTQAFNRQGPFEAQVRFRRFDGEYRWLSSTGAPRFRADGAFLGYVGCSVDVSDIKASEEALKEADRRKDDFLAMLGHELRNPLAGIVSGAQVLSMVDLNDEAAEMRAVIARQASHMSQIVDDLLDVSRITRGKLTLRRQHVDLAKLVREAVADYQRGRQFDGRPVECRTPPEPVWVWGDATRLTQALSNVLHNSFKFSDGPNVIAVEMSCDDAARQARVVVQDQGIGMAPETLERLFVPFNQADTSLERSRGGLGLGLALTRGLVALHEGAVTASSPGLGRGSAIEITLPLADAPLSPVEPVARPMQQTLRVLIVDDRPDAMLPLSRLLEKAGHQVATACDGPSGIACAVEFEPDVVLCDIGLAAEMNGYQVSRSIRAIPSLSHVYMAAVTGYTQEEDRRHAKEAGFDYHLKKPVDKEALDDLLTRFPRF